MAFSAYVVSRSSRIQKQTANQVRSNKAFERTSLRASASGLVPRAAQLAR